MYTKVGYNILSSVHLTLRAKIEIGTIIELPCVQIFEIERKTRSSFSERHARRGHRGKRCLIENPVGADRTINLLRRTFCMVNNFYTH